ncbi:hypothetical protein M5K25_020150 [Dendrobium thyrsiflorum]|uniref:Uncharacterized protein n=1 Tax=Dendrobium thyrsiflorum TaxID=117978 RepID=A0ABD0UG64_DENTH
MVVLGKIKTADVLIKRSMMPGRIVLFATPLLKHIITCSLTILRLTPQNALRLTPRLTNEKRLNTQLHNFKPWIKISVFWWFVAPFITCGVNGIDAFLQARGKALLLLQMLSKKLSYSKLGIGNIMTSLKRSILVFSSFLEVLTLAIWDVDDDECGQISLPSCRFLAAYTVDLWLFDGIWVRISLLALLEVLVLARYPWAGLVATVALVLSLCLRLQFRLLS